MRSNYKLIKCGKLFDGVKESFDENAEILIEGNRIKEVGHQLSFPEGTEIIDLSALTVTPGMIDVHMHFHYGDWHTRTKEVLGASPEYKTLSALYTAQRAMHRGFTSIRQVGMNSFDGFGMIDVKRVIERGYFEGPRLRCCPSYIGSVGSNADQPYDLRTNPWMWEALTNKNPAVCNGADEFQEIVRKYVRYGADFIKLMATGSFMGLNSSPDDFDFSDAEISAIIDTAHRLKKKVTAHAYADAPVRKLVEKGIDGIEHGALVTEETLELMEKKGVYLVPTFDAYEEIFSMDPKELAKKPEHFKERLNRFKPQLFKTRELILKSNLKMGYGSDLVTVHQCYENGYEYRSWMRCGINPFKALKAATSVNASIIEIPDIGVIAPGKYADIAGWKRDLLTDENALLDCGFVMKDGVVYEAESSIDLQQ